MMQKFEEREHVVLENQGQKIFGVFHRPLTHSTKIPVVLFIHGLAGHKTGKYRLYVSLASQLAKIGIGALRIDFRGSGDSEGEFCDITVDGVLSDASLALNFIKKDPKIDQKRIGLFGRSFGASLIMMMAEKHPHIKTIAVWSPMYDTREWEEAWKPIQYNLIPKHEQEKRMCINGQRLGRPFLEGFFKIDLAESLKKIEDKPLLMIFGERDEILSPSHFENYQKKREKSADLSKFLKLPEADHDFSRLEDQQIAIETTVNWFKETL